ncbi:hypothetical protein Tco_1183951 [Tanacetum coccineum]
MKEGRQIYYELYIRNFQHLQDCETWEYSQVIVCVTDILLHSDALNIIFSLLDDRDFHCCDSGWRNVLFCHLTIEFFLFRVSTQKKKSSDTTCWIIILNRSYLLAIKREKRKTFYGYARGLESRHDVYSTKRILAVTQVKEGDFPRLRINDIEDMILLVVQNRLTNLSGDDVSNFAIAFRMFTRSLVIQKRVEDLQLGVESYQKKINVTKPKTTKPSIRKRDPYNPYQDPQIFIYVDTLGRNKLINDLRVLRIILVILTEHQSDTKVIHNDDGNPSRANIKQALGRSVLTYSKIKMDVEVKNIKKDGYTRFQHQEQYEHVGPEVTRSQEGKRSQDDDKRLCLVDDLKEVQDSHASQSLLE